MSVDLFPTWTVGSVDLTEYPYSVDRDNAVEIGEPEMVVEGVTSQIADGDLERVVRHGNRTYVLPIYIEGPTLLDVAEAEATLRAEVRKRGLELTHDPGDGFAPASVYEVQTARLTPVRNEGHESHLIRKFTLTLTCAPWARSAAMTTAVALDVGATPVTTTLSTADSTTGWSTVAPGVLSATGGYVASTPSQTDPSGERYYLFFATTVDATTPYVVIEWQTTTPYDRPPTLVSAPLLETVTLAGGWQKSTYSAAGYSNLPFSVLTTGVGEFRIRDLKRTNQPPGTSRQRTRILEVGGTERTPASIHIEAANGTDLLSTTFVHTSPEDGSGYSPPLRRWRTSGNGTPTSDTATFSGLREPIHPNPVVAKVPTSALPEGGYQLAAFMRCTTSATVPIYWNVGTIPPGGTRTGDVTARVSWTFTANVWQLVPLGIVSLPTIRTAAGEVQVDILRDAGSAASVEIDDAWLFRIDDDCALSIVNVAYPNLWLDSPDVTNPVPTVWVGSTDTTRTHPGTGLVTMGNHVLSADGTALFTASSNTDNPKASAAFYDRFHSNAAK